MDQEIVSPEFIEEITEAFSIYASNNQITVKEIKFVGNLHNNFLSDVARVRITGSQELNDGASGEYNEVFIVKLLPKDAAYVKIYGCDIAFENEKHAYLHIIPKINAYSKRPIPCPKYVTIDKTIESKMVILEDLSEKGYHNFDKLTGFTEELVAAVLSELANLHAASFTIKRQDPGLFERLTNSVQEVLYRTDKDTSLLKTQEDSLDLMMEVLKRQKNQNPEYEEIVRSLKGRTEALQIECLSQKGPFAVINHGDMWASNILKKQRDDVSSGASSDNSDENNKDDIKLIDFQIMRYTSFAADLNYFFYVNLPPQMRNERMNIYLEYYRKELIDCITDNQLKEEIERELTMERLKEEMQEYSTYGFICGLWIFPVFYNAVNVIVKTTEALQKHSEMSLANKIDSMKDEQIERLLGLMETYATSLKEKELNDERKAEAARQAQNQNQSQQGN